jgi:hypothetical protein
VAFKSARSRVSTCGRTEKNSVTIDPMKTDAIGWLAIELRPPR